MIRWFNTRKMMATHTWRCIRQTERENSGGGLWLRWVLANAAGLATGNAPFAFIQNILGGEQGTLRHEISSMADLTAAGAVIGLLQWLALRNHVQQGRSRRPGIALMPVVSRNSQPCHHVTRPAIPNQAPANTASPKIPVTIREKITFRSGSFKSAGFDIL